MALSRDQRNEVLGLIEASGLSRDDFRWDDATTGNRTLRGPVEHHTLVHRATGMPFTFRSQPSMFEAPATAVVLAGGDEVGVPRINNIDGWTTQITKFKAWSDRLMNELGVPDLWTDLRAADGGAFSAVTEPTTENSPFTNDEREDIVKALSDLRTEVRDSFELTADSLCLLDAGVAQLIEGSEHIGRKDWLLMFIGVMVSVAIAAAIPHLLPALLAAFGPLRHLFGGGPLPLPPE